jgi:hypothetical protein
MTGLPDLLTVEEAARVLRIGRTKAYAMTVEWRRTHGKTGLPVVDFGNALRVPRCQLEAIVGGPITSLEDPPTSPEIEAPPPASDRASGGTSPIDPATAVPDASADTGPRPKVASARPSRRPAKRRARKPEQPTLPFAS